MIDQSLYANLADDISGAIIQGSLAAGSRLPSVRASSLQYGLSINTVTAAYRLLEDRGFIEARPQSGFYVRSALQTPHRLLRPTPVGLALTGRESFMAQVLRAQQRTDSVDLALACPRGEGFYPGERLARITGSLLRRHPEIVSNYALPPGSTLLQEQIARRAFSLGMTLAPNDILITHGALEGLHLALRAVTRPGDWVGIESPSYFNLYPLFSSLGLNIIEIPTHPQYGLVVDEVETLLESGKLTALVAMPTVHNPLGCTMPIEAKRRLAELVNQHRIPLIEDAVYAELQFNDPLQPMVKSFDKEGWIMLCGSFSKTLAPDYRIGWLEAGRFRDLVEQIKFSSSIGESALLCESIGLFLESGGYDHHLRTIRRRYAVQVTAVRGLIAKYFPVGTLATQPTGGFLIWIELPHTVDSLALFNRAIEHKIAIIPGLIYSDGASFRSCMRLSCCYDLDERHVAALRCLGELATELAAERINAPYYS